MNVPQPVRPLAAVVADERRNAERRLARLGALRTRLSAEVSERSGAVDVLAPTRRGRWWVAARIPDDGDRVVHARIRARDGEPVPDPDEFWSAEFETVVDESSLRVGARVGHVDQAALADTAAWTTDRTGRERFDLVVAGRLRARGIAPDLIVSDRGESVIVVELTRDGRPATAVRLGRSRGRTVLFTEPDPQRWLELARAGDRVVIASRSLDGDRLALLDEHAPALDRIPIEGADARALPLPHGRTLVLADGRLHEWMPGSPPAVLALDLPLGSTIEDARVVGPLVVLHVRIDGNPALAWFDPEAPADGLTLRHPARPGETLDLLDPDGDIARGTVSSLTLPGVPWRFDARTRVLDVGPEPAEPVRQLRTRARGGAGAGIPVTIALSGLARPAEPRPLVLLVYGAYGVPFEPRYSPGVRSLLDRGVLLAIAHVRGGGELGPAWHDAARGLSKHVSVDDYLDVARHLIAEGWTGRGMIVAQGSSAGATVVGAALNRDPGLFAGAVVTAPFVDPLAALLDESSPLAAVDVPEWGDPHTEAGRRALRELSPVHNVDPRVVYPPVLASAGIRDPRAPVRSVARWIELVREAGSDATLVLDPGGHDGAPSRSAERDRFALELAWMLDVLGLA